ncbi:hypothetical protein QJS04_geneDACA023469 [Acorus gramineus]|uniref:FAR1 domain-containing protein n=1 Tax=Acorus gramineus TaxID=55184 RepID=A0AAV9BTD1_ACOGR|nr:hypothetical protein QJS04_geneDACA023469 [Acorus gramineus]
MNYSFDSVENVEELYGEDGGIWIPDIDDQIKPAIGMSFDSLEKGEKFYMNYAKMAGFSVRKSSTKYCNVEGSKELYLRDFVCSKEGFRNSSSTSNTIQKKNPRTYKTRVRKAKINFMKEEDEKWNVNGFVEENIQPNKPLKYWDLREILERTNGDVETRFSNIILRLHWTRSSRSASAGRRENPTPRRHFVFERTTNNQYLASQGLNISKPIEIESAVYEVQSESQSELPSRIMLWSLKGIQPSGGNIPMKK